SDEIRWLSGLCTLAGRRVFYQDAWATAAVVEAAADSAARAGVTWARRNPYRARMGWLRPDRRIDYLFVTAARPDGGGGVRAARVVFDRADSEGVFPSDHFGVLADVQVTADAPAATKAGEG